MTLATGSAPRLLSIGAFLLALVAVVFLSVVPQSANDFWLQTKIGQMIFQDHSIPKTVLFPFTAAQNAQFNAHEWLSSLAFFALVAAVGERGIPLAMGVAGLTLFGVMASLAYRRSGKNLPVALILGLTAVVVENYRHTPRPELLALILLGVYWHFLESCRRSPSLIAWIGALSTVVLWTNVHGSFILAPILGFIYAVGVWVDKFRATVVTEFSSATSPQSFTLFAFAALLCTCLNPFGVDLLAFVVGFSNSSSVSELVVEWLPTLDPRFVGLRGLWIGLGCAAVTFVVMGWRWRKLSAVDALTFLLFLVLAFKAIRFLVYLGMVAAYILSTLVPHTWRNKAAQLRLFSSAAALGALVFALSASYGNASGGFPHKALNDKSFTQPMLKVLGDPSVKGNVLCSFELGAELVYRAYPRLRPSIDSRIDSYGADYYRFHEQLIQDDQRLTKFVKQYDVRYVLLDQYRFQIFSALPSWKQKYWAILSMDHKHVLLKRVDR